MAGPYPYSTPPLSYPSGGGGYNINPSPTSYNPTFGGIPGAIGLPNPFADLSKALPGLGGVNQQAITDLGAQFSGSVSPGTQALLQNLDAAQGARAGMPGSQLFRNKTLRDLGLTAEGQVNQAFSNYGKLIPSVSGTQTVPPALQTQVASRNAALASAPVPAAAQSYAQQLFDQYLQMTKGPGGGTTQSLTSPAGGTAQPVGTPSPAAPIYGGAAVGPDATYPGTEIPGFPNLDTILGSPAIDTLDLSSLDPYSGLI